MGPSEWVSFALQGVGADQKPIKQGGKLIRGRVDGEDPALIGQDPPGKASGLIWGTSGLIWGATTRIILSLDEATLRGGWEVGRGASLGHAFIVQSGGIGGSVDED